MGSNAFFMGLGNWSERVSWDETIPFPTMIISSLAYVLYNLMLTKLFKTSLASGSDFGLDLPCISVVSNYTSSRSIPNDIIDNFYTKLFFYLFHEYVIS